MGQKKLKIAFLCAGFGTVNRGVETYVLELSKRLRSKFEVEVLSGKDANSLDKIMVGKYDLVIPTNGRVQALIAAVGKSIKGYKTLISGQAGIGRDDIWNIAITAPDVYIGLTDYEATWASKWAWKTRVIKIPNGVDLHKFTPQGPRVDLNLPHPVILSVGALQWYKHHERTIKALSYLNQGSLLIIGSGSEEQNLLKMGKNLGERFKIIKVDYQDIDKYYRSADLFSLPSWDRESFGIVYVEGMASGLAIVAPNDPPRQEIVGDAGILVDVTDPVIYAQALRQALNRKWGEIPRKQAGKFSWDKIALQYEQLVKGMFI